MGFDCRMDRRMTMLLADYERVFLKAFPDVSVLSAHVAGIKGVGPPEGKVRGAQNKVGPFSAVQQKVLVKTYPYLNGDHELSDIWAKEQFMTLQDNMFARPIIGPEVMASSDIYSPPNVVQILLKCVNFQYPRLTSVAFSLLSRHMTQKAALIKRCKDVQILVYVLPPLPPHISASNFRLSLRLTASNISPSSPHCLTASLPHCLTRPLCYLAASAPGTRRWCECSTTCTWTSASCGGRPSGSGRTTRPPRPTPFARSGVCWRR
jgi:hypothetical protein